MTEVKVYAIRRKSDGLFRIRGQGWRFGKLPKLYPLIGQAKCAIKRRWPKGFEEHWKEYEIVSFVLVPSGEMALRLA